MVNMVSITEGALNLRRLVLVLITMGVAFLLASGVAHAAPANDDFANAQEIPDLGMTRNSYTGLPELKATVSGTNVEATKESGEPNHANDPGGKSVWYEWTPQESGTTFIDTFGSNFDTVLGVYTGSAVNDLTRVTSNDDAPSIGINRSSSQSWVAFTASAGTTYHIVVDGSNKYGNEASSGSITLNVVFDNDAPGAPRITSPANDSLDTDGSFTVSGTAEPFSRVKLYEGDTLKGQTIVFNSDASWSIPLRGVADGSHTYTATATDDAGNTSSESETLTVIVDTIAPDAPIITTPAENARLNVHSFSVSGTAEEGAKVELFEGEVSMGEATADSDGTWSVALNDVSDGSHTYKAKATDRAGYISTESESRTVIVDKTAPDAPLITTPAEGAGLNSGSFSVSGTTEAGAKVELLEGEVSKGEATAGSDGAWSIDLTGVSDGSHSYKAKATDAAGNTSVESQVRTVIVDTTAPAVRRVVPRENATGIAPGANVSAFFSEAMRATSVKSAFKLYKKGSTTALEAKVAYDATAKKAILDPRANLQRGATYKVVVSVGAKDLAGNALDQNPTATGNQQKVWFFTVSP